MEYKPYEEEIESQRDHNRQLEEEQAVEYAIEEQIQRLLEVAYEFSNPIIEVIKREEFPESDINYILGAIQHIVRTQLAKQTEGE